MNSLILLISDNWYNFNQELNQFLVYRTDPIYVWFHLASFLPLALHEAPHAFENSWLEVFKNNLWWSWLKETENTIKITRINFFHGFLKCIYFFIHILEIFGYFTSLPTKYCHHTWICTLVCPPTSFHYWPQSSKYDRGVDLLEWITPTSLVKIDIVRHLLLSPLKKRLTWRESTQKGIQ